jgi:hypothetical protein
MRNIEMFSGINQNPESRKEKEFQNIEIQYQVSSSKLLSYLAEKKNIEFFVVNYVGKNYFEKFSLYEIIEINNPRAKDFFPNLRRTYCMTDGFDPIKEFAKTVSYVALVGENETITNETMTNVQLITSDYTLFDRNTEIIEGNHQHGSLLHRIIKRFS